MAGIKGTPTIAMLLAVLWIVSASSNAVANDTTIVRGQCAPESHIAEGAIGEDLSKRQSRFFCDSAVVTLFSDNARHVLINFAESKSVHARQIGYAGMMEDQEILDVRSVYLEGDSATPVTDGACKFFFKDMSITSITCGAAVDKAGRRTVPVVSFNADRPVKLMQTPRTPQPVVGCTAERAAEIARTTGANINDPCLVHWRSIEVRKHPERASDLECMGFKAYEDPQPPGHPIALADCDRITRQDQQRLGLPATGMSASQKEVYRSAWGKQ